LNTVSNIENADIKAAAAIDASKIADGTVSSAEFQQLNAVTSAVVGINDAQALTNKAIDADVNTLSNIENADIKAAAAIDATKIADGSVNNTAFQQLNTVGSAIVGISDIQTLTNKTIDADLNTVSNIENADIKAAAAIDASKIADGTVSSAEFQQLNAVTSAVAGINDAQTLTNKTIDADLNTITNIENADIKVAAAIDATKIADGSVDNTAFQQLALGNPFAFETHTSFTIPVDGDLLTWDNTNGRWDALAPVVTGDMFAATYDPSAVAGDAFIFDTHASFTPPVDGDLLTWDNTNGRWDALAPVVTGDMFAATYDPSAVAGDAFIFDTHASFTPPVDGDLLTWDNTNGRWDALAPVVTGDMFAATYDPSAVAGDAFIFDTHASFTPPVDGDVLTWDNTNSRWDAMASNGFTLPYTNSVADINALFNLDNIGTGPAARFANTTFNGTAVLVEGNIAFQQGSNRKIAIQDNTVAAGNDLEVAAGGTTLAANGGVLALKGGSSTLGTGGNIRLEPGTGVSNGGIDMRGITRFGQTSVIAPGRIELEDDDASNIISISAPSNVAISYDLTLPPTLTAGVLTTDAGGTLTWNPAGAGNYIIDANENQKGGASAAAAITTGVQNVVLGNLSASGLTVGNGNVVAGHSGGLSLVGGSDNLVVGRLADASGDGNNNVVLGGSADAIGSNSVAIGRNASVDGNQSVALGQNSSVTGGAVRAVAIGSGTAASQNNTVVMGQGPTVVYNVGVGTATPAARLEVTTHVGEPSPGIRLNHQAASGSGLRLDMSDATNTANGLEVNNGSAGIAASFSNNNVGSTANTMIARNVGVGTAGEFEINNATNGVAAVFSHTNGLGSAGVFDITNGSSSSASLVATTSGTGAAIRAFKPATAIGSVVDVAHDAATGNGILVNMNSNSTDAGLRIINTTPGANSVEVDGNINTTANLTAGGAMSVTGDAMLNGRLITPPATQTIVTIATPTKRILRLDISSPGQSFSIIGAGQDGQEVIILSVGTVSFDVINNNAGVGGTLLDNGGTFTMNPNASLHMVYDATLQRWIEIGRKR
jgi:hypothetical protein